MAHHTYLPGCRKHWALSQRELAHLVGVSASTVSRHENGTLSPSVASLIALQFIFARPAKKLFPVLHRSIEEVIVERAAHLEAIHRGKDDADSVRKIELFEGIIRRAEPVPAL